MKKCTKKIPKHNAGAIVGNSLNFVGDMTQNVIRSQNEGVSFGSVLGGMGKGAATGAALGSVIPGIGTVIGGIGGAVIGGITSAVGQSGSVDENTGEVTKPSGLTRLFGWGRSDKSLYAKSNRIKTSNVDKQLTPYMNEQFMSDPYNHLNTNVYVNAAEGGIMRTPVEALVSKGELIYNPVTKKLSQVPGSKGKPNKADDVYTRLYEGDVVISNSPTMLMANGKTPAQNLMGMVDKYATGGTVKAREAIIKKVVNWQEANKTEPQEYAMYDSGTGKDGVENKPIKKRRNSIWNRMQDKWNASAINDWLENYYNNIDKYEDHAIIDGRLFIKHDGKWYDSHKGGLGRAVKDNVLPESGKGYMTDRYQTVPFKQGVFSDVDKSKIVKHKKNNIAVSDIVKPNSNNGNTTNTELDFVSFRHVNPDYDTPKSDIATNDINSVITESKKGTVGKPSSGKKTAASRATTSAAQQEEKLTPEQIAESLRIQDIGERHWLRGSVSEPNQSLASLAQTTPGKLKIQKLAAPSAPKTHVDDNDSTNFNTNLGDLAYKAAVLTQPLWGKAKAEPVNYDLPYVNFVPTSIDVTNDLANIDRNAAAAQYDLANRYRNTGAGLAATLQLAQNRSAQQSAIRQWQTNAQNELIGKNVGIYNDWSKTRTGIMNDVYNKSAQNRAAARNINRQNKAAWLSNWGTILRDDKQFAADLQNKELQTEALKPLIQSVYENSDTLIPMLAQYTVNKNIKKKSPTR